MKEFLEQALIAVAGIVMLTTLPFMMFPWVDPLYLWKVIWAGLTMLFGG